jgi:hypothetical protein
MGFATHLGPWLLGTVKNTTGTTAGTVQNLGATMVMQTKNVAATDSAASVAFVLPAGAILFELYLFQSGATFTSGTSGTFTVYNGGTQIAQATITTGTAGILGLNPDSAARTALFANVGSTDAIITYTPATLNAGSGVLVATYVVRGSDGAMYPTASQN